MTIPTLAIIVAHSSNPRRYGRNTGNIRLAMSPDS